MPVLPLVRGILVVSEAVITHKVCIYYTNPLETPYRMFLLVPSDREADWLGPSCC